MKKILVRAKSVDLGGALIVAIALACACGGVNAWAAEPTPEERTLSNGEAADFLTQCMLEGDAREASTEAGAYACCSETQGYCVKCPPSPSQACTLHPTPASGKNPFIIEIIDPGVFAPTSSTPDTIGPRAGSLNALRNFLVRNKAAADEEKKYE